MMSPGIIKAGAISLAQNDASALHNIPLSEFPV
jgi:hypothetical protein